jgi:2-polyprenyl-3-methyl-5-hydroxy-6-metoxy-1,4-benzoquinol methylase
VEAKLHAGINVADIGCGVGFSTLLMAQAYPDSRFTGYDFHAPSIEEARRHAQAHGLGDRVQFEVATAKEVPGRDFDLVTMYDCLHDMGDPRGCAAHMREILAPDGSWMIVEPIAGNRPEDNLNPVGRLYYNASTMICVPTSLDQEVGEGLGAQAGEARLTEVIRDGGFTHVRRAADGPFNMVLEAR